MGRDLDGPTAQVAVATAIELVGGALLILGVATAVAGRLVVLVVLGAILFVYIGNGIVIQNGGWGLAGVAAAAGLAPAAVGAGWVQCRPRPGRPPGPGYGPLTVGVGRPVSDVLRTCCAGLVTVQ